MLKYLIYNITILSIIIFSCSKIERRTMIEKDDTIELVVNGDIIKEEIKKENNYDCLLTSSKDYVVNINETELVCNIYDKNKEKNYKNVEIRFDEKWSLKRLKNKKNKNKYIHFYPNELSNQNILWIGKIVNGGDNCRCFPKWEDIYWFPKIVSAIRCCNSEFYNEKKLCRYNWFSIFLTLSQLTSSAILCYINISNLLFTSPMILMNFMLGCGAWCEYYDKVINCCTYGVFAPIFYISAGWDLIITSLFILIHLPICILYVLLCKKSDKSPILKVNNLDNNKYLTMNYYNKKYNNPPLANSNNDVIEVTYNGEKIKFPKQELYQRLGINTNNNNSRDINDNLSNRGSVFHNKEIEKFKLENDVRKAKKNDLNNPPVNIQVVNSGEKIETIDSKFLKKIGNQINQSYV